MLSIDLENQSSSRDPSPCSSFHTLPSCTPNSTSPLAPISEADLPNHLPSFSIRDYVLSARRKSIEKNWPFSLKTLHLCLKHGVTDLLPPFQTLNSLSHQNESIENQLFNVESSKGKITESYLDLSSSRFGDENDLPSTTTSISLSEIESRSGHHKCSTRSKVFTQVKSQVRSRRVGRKCNLIVKFGAQSGYSTPEDISSNCSSVLDSMASKVCPVCKAFSSSSNTTLNAHIDQCLSAQPTSEGIKLKHRIKPRKSRLMTEVYSSAEPCTLEDLDTRNGTNWAACRSTLNPETNTSGPVYIDANGTKVGILSKLSAPTVEENETRFKTSKGNKFSKKKMNSYPQKSSKFSSQGTKRLQDEDCATFKQWICSKRRGGLRKVRHQGTGKFDQLFHMNSLESSNSSSGNTQQFVNESTGLQKKPEKLSESSDKTFLTFRKSVLSDNDHVVGSEFKFDQNPDPESFTQAGLNSDTCDESVKGFLDPIPIPGPPGSYLPSPRDVGSEDFQSSLDFLDAVDEDSSDSPLSVVSTISNPIGTNLCPETNFPEKGFVTCCCKRKDYGNSKPEALIGTGNSGATPVLRLMGKNLIVNNNEESPQPDRTSNLNSGILYNWGHQEQEGWRKAVTFSSSSSLNYLCYPAMKHHVHGDSASLQNPTALSEKKHVESSSSYHHVKSPVFYYHSGFS